MWQLKGKTVTFHGFLKFLFHFKFQGTAVLSNFNFLSLKLREK